MYLLCLLATSIFTKIKLNCISYLIQNMSLTIGSVCVCGKKRGNLYSINWDEKLSHNYLGPNIRNYFKSPKTILVLIKTNILSGNYFILITLLFN